MNKPSQDTWRTRDAVICAERWKAVFDEQVAGGFLVALLELVRCCRFTCGNSYRRSLVLSKGWWNATKSREKSQSTTSIEGSHFLPHFIEENARRIHLRGGTEKSIGLVKLLQFCVSRKAFHEKRWNLDVGHIEIEVASKKLKLKFWYSLDQEEWAQYVIFMKWSIDEKCATAIFFIVFF